ncbi:glucosaminidase domain-containing protein [Salinicoccus sp. ID82-1]|uniref:N-acetylmuramoyl-L-alanine amidase n=1 Tax=Salinicoccus sp. ID82-1 TaxID=2820269 RepID=UPI001F0224BE|nr:N-acetylmuramoyl-L-alanine amidase [Salinicoccus sp. ID82-1]MCG1009963.1 glucosaminidase domain-containing protein [Salinicoccus sp. ID82-1]
MKYKNRLIVPTLISTALFGAALNAEAEEIPKEEMTQNHIDTVEEPDVPAKNEETQPLEDKDTYIESEDASLDGTRQVEETIETEAASVETQTVEATVEETTPDTVEASTNSVNDEETVEVPVAEPFIETDETTAAPVIEEVLLEETVEESTEETATDDSEATAPVEEPVVKKNPETEDAQEETLEPPEMIVEDSEEPTYPAADAPISEESEETPEAVQNTEDVVGTEPAQDASSEENIEDAPDESEEKFKKEIDPEIDTEENAEDEASEESRTDEAAEFEDDTSEEETDTVEKETDDKEGEASEESVKTDEAETLSEEAVSIKEDADEIVVDEALETELITMLSKYDIEPDSSRSFFRSTATSSRMTLAQAITNINDYIEQNNFKAPRITYNHIAGLPKYNYRNGKGKPEGVVLHETANNNSTIHGEINWMSRNYRNAFVHAFVDKDNIIQVADTDHLAWGAGPNANPRFLHVELVRHDNTHDFAKSINNYADYIANLLYKYKLPVDSAEADAKGTLWSHSAVSTHLGGTNHVDPYTYFSKFGYSYRDVEKLIEEKYTDLYNKKTAPKVTMPVTTEEAEYVGRIHNDNKGLYASVTDVKTASADDHINKTFYVTRKATYNYDNYYLVQSDLEDSYVGWVHEDDLRKLERTAPSEYKKAFSVKDASGYFFDTPWGTPTQRESLKGYSSKKFVSDQIMKISNTNYLFGQFDGRSGWIKLSDLEEYVLAAPSPESKTPVESINAARFKGADQTVVYKSYKDKSGTVRSQYNDYTLFTKQRVNYNGKLFYSLYDGDSNAFVGWAKEDDMHVYSKSSEVNHKKDYAIKDLDNSLLSVAFGDDKQQISTFRNIGSYLFSAQKKVSIGALDYYYGSVGDQTGWAHYRHITPLEAVNHKRVSDSSAARTRSSSSDMVYSTPYSVKGGKSKFLADTTFFTKEKVSFKGDDYYSLYNPENDKFIGWMKGDDLATYDRTAEKKHVKFYVVDNLDEHLLDVAFGDKTQRVDTYRNTGSQLFTAQKHVRVGALDYYYGRTGGTFGWAHFAHVTPLDEVHHVRTNDTSAVRLKSSGDKKVKALPYDVDGTVSQDYMDRTFYTRERIEWKDNTVYSIYDAVTNKAVGWANAEDLSIYDMSEAKSHNVNYIVNNIDKPLLAAAFGDDKQQIASYRKVGSYLFEAEKHVQVGSLHYYYGKINGQYGWAHYKHVTPESEVAIDRRSSTHAARIGASLDDGLYTSIYDIKGKQNTSITNSTLFTKERVRFNNRDFYSVYSNINDNFVGYVRAEDISLKSMSTPKEHKSNYHIINGESHLMAVPYGSYKQRVGQLDGLNSNDFKAEQSVVIDGTTYYYGHVGSYAGWVTADSVGEYIVNTIPYNKSLEEVLDIQMSLRAKPQAWVSGGGWRDATRDEVRYYLDSANHQSDTWNYTFLDLNRAQNISSTELNNKLLDGKGILDNQGLAFVRAANQYGINEVYLISHALHETGNGTSQLSQGVRLDENGNISENGTLYYNMYGIGAYDHNPVLEGARYAQQMGWDSPSKAVTGGAQFISSGYFNRNQTTLYAMRWNPLNPGTYQYATDVNWAYATARNLQNYYDQLGINGQYFTRYTF